MKFRKNWKTSKEPPSLRGGTKTINMTDFNKCLPNSEMQAAFERFRNLKSPEEKRMFQQEMRERLSSMSEAERQKYMADSKAGLQATLEACDEYIKQAEKAILKERLGELPEIISLSYIAKKYFGKSRNWLYQRINGYMVNGKRAEFTQNEFQTFLDALDDIGTTIRNISASLKLN